MKKNKFTSFLMGGLGNQMFQIAYAINQGLKHNVSVSFLPESFTPNQGKTPTNYTSNILRKIDFNRNREEKYLICEEKTWNEPDIQFDVNENIEFRGYFQSSKNFSENSNYIKELFSPDEFFLEKVRKKFPAFSSQDSISIHIRRGDYLKFKDVHGVIDFSYIEYCLSKCEKNLQVYVLTDDKNWVMDNFKGKNYILVDNFLDFEELWFISLCRTNIMSCSSFSWWGSFLNKNENKKVFVPNKWFGPNGPFPYYNIYEKDWNKINVEFKNGFLYVNEF